MKYIPHKIFAILFIFSSFRPIDAIKLPIIEMPSFSFLQPVGIWVAAIVGVSALPVAIYGTIYAGGGTRDFLRERVRRNRSAGEAEEFLQSLEVFLQTGRGAANCVDQRIGCRWFHWRTADPLFDANHLVVQVPLVDDQRDEVLDVLYQDLVFQNILIFKRYQHGYQAYQAQFVQVAGQDGQEAGVVQLAVDTLRAILESIDDEIQDIGEKRNTLVERNQTNRVFCHDEYGRRVTKPVNLEQLYLQACQIQNRGIRHVGDLHHLRPEELEAIENRFRMSGYSKMRILSLMLLQIDQRFKIAFNRAIEMYIRLVRAQLHTEVIRDLIGQELGRRIAVQAPIQQPPAAAPAAAPQVLQLQVGQPAVQGWQPAR